MTPLSNYKLYLWHFTLIHIASVYFNKIFGFSGCLKYILVGWSFKVTIKLIGVS